MSELVQAAAIYIAITSAGMPLSALLADWLISSEQRRKVDRRRNP